MTDSDNLDNPDQPDDPRYFAHGQRPPKHASAMDLAFPPDPDKAMESGLTMKNLETLCRSVRLAPHVLVKKQH